MSLQRPLLVSNDADLIDDVLRLSAANGVEVHLAADADAARSRWTLAPLVVVGEDALGPVAQARLTRRRDVVLITREPSTATWQRAVEIGAEHVVALPEAERWLIDRLADSGEGPTRAGRVVGITGCGGGAGASTFAATLAVVAAARSLRVLLVDADPLGGGIDVLLGLEDVAGVRWADVADTRGRLGVEALAAAVPVTQGVHVLSWGRTGPLAAGAASMSAVIDAGVRGYDLVVVDLPRCPDPAADVVLGRADETLLVMTNRVRAAAAALRVIDVLQGRSALPSLVVRSAPGGVTDDAVLADLGRPVVGRLPFSRAVSARAEEGEPPVARDAYGRACAEVLPAIVEARGSAA